MITAPLVHSIPPMKIIEPSGNHAGLTRLFAAAIVSRQFRETLLRDPQAALRDGYLGTRFPLSSEEQALITSIRARSLSDFANQVTRTLRNQS